MKSMLLVEKEELVLAEVIDEREQTLNQLLVDNGWFRSKQGIIIMAATNRPDILNPACILDQEDLIDK